MARRKQDKDIQSTKSTPLAQRAYDALRDAIEKGALAPGDRVSEYKVAEWLEISRTPAREGLQRLEAEGLLAYHARRGLIVATIDRDALHELFLAREVIESALARYASHNGSGPELMGILAHCELEPELIDDREKMYEHNKVFHDLIRRAAHNRYLSKFSVQIDDVVSADRRGSSLISPERRSAVIEEHRRLSEAIAARDGEKAAKAASDHVKAAYLARLKVGSVAPPVTSDTQPVSLTPK